MIKADINRFNKMCAEFMEFEYLDEIKCYKTSWGSYPLHKLNFHSDWNRIMMVVEKIKSVKKKNDSDWAYITLALLCVNIEVLKIAILTYITLYNQKNKKR